MLRIALGLHFVLSLLILTGCQSTPKLPDGERAHMTSIPDDYESQRGLAELQSLMRPQGLYANKNGVVKLLDRSLECPIELQAHRGDSGHIENTREAISKALQNGFDSVEIDVQLLGDGQWVAYHDDYTGKTAVFQNGAKRLISRLDSAQFRELRLRDVDGTLTTSSPATARQVIRAFASHAKGAQWLNIEVKGKAQPARLRELDALVNSQLKPGQYGYSSMELDNLVQLRKINPHVYLGLIQQPEPASVRQLRNQMKTALSSDTMYQRNARTLNKTAGYMESQNNRQHRDYTSQTMLMMIKNRLGTNAGLHLDIRRFNETPNVRIRAREQGLKRVATYTINGHEYHQNLLNSLLANNRGPDAAIVDDSVYRVCRQAYPYRSPAMAASSNADKGHVPDDLDFQRLLDEGAVLPGDMYIKLNGQAGYRIVRSNSTTAQSTRQHNMALPDAPKDTQIDLSTDGPALIRFNKE